MRQDVWRFLLHEDVDVLHRAVQFEIAEVEAWRQGDAAHLVVHDHLLQTQNISNGGKTQEISNGRKTQKIGNGSKTLKISNGRKTQKIGNGGKTQKISNGGKTLKISNCGKK